MQEKDNTVTMTSRRKLDTGDSNDTVIAFDKELSVECFTEKYDDATGSVKVTDALNVASPVEAGAEGEEGPTSDEQRAFTFTFWLSLFILSVALSLALFGWCIKN